MSAAMKGAGVLLLYFAGAYSALFLLNLDPPRWLELCVVALAMPMQLLMLPWLGVLRAWGWVEGEWIQQPSLLGMIFLAVVYSVALWLLITGIQRIRAK